jgi:putative DNA primase/helicase
MTQATDAYFETQDSFSTWIDECCERDPNEWTASTPLFTSWKTWAYKAGVRYGNQQDFRDAMERAGFVWKKTNKGNGYEGLRGAVTISPHWQDDRG